MSQSRIARFPRSASSRRDNNPEAAEAARVRIAELPETYLAHASPASELAAGTYPVSPAAAASGVTAAGAVIAPPAGNEASPGQAEPTYGAPHGRDGGGHYHLPSRLKPLVTGAVTFILLLLVFKAPIFLSQLNYLTQPKTATTGQSNQAAGEVPLAPIIDIPKISVNAPVVYATDNNENDILTDLQSGVVHYANTALPGQIGNSVIFGHSSNDWWEQGNYKFVFVLLDKLQPGDSFSVNYNSHQYIYQVTSTEVVAPTDVSVLNPTADAEMTLITCTPPGTSWQRLVVHSKQISPKPGTASSPAGQPVQSGGTLPSNSPSLLDKIGGWWHDLGHWFGGGNSPQDTTTAPGASGGTGPATSPATIPATQ